MLVTKSLLLVKGKHFSSKNACQLTLINIIMCFLTTSNLVKLAYTRNLSIALVTPMPLLVVKLIDNYSLLKVRKQFDRNPKCNPIAFVISPEQGWAKWKN